MPATLIRLTFIAAVAGAAMPVWGAGMPDFGTKNFSPASEVPAYFSNENGALGATETTDDGADDIPARSVRTASAPQPSDWATSTRHGKFAAAHASVSGSRAQLRSAGPVHSISARSTRGEAGARYQRHFAAGTAKPAKSARHAWARSSSHRG
jgi:hypothetical protein